MADVDLTELAVILQDTLGRIDNTVLLATPPSPVLGTIGSVALVKDGKLTMYGPKTTDPDPWGEGLLLSGEDGRNPEFRASGGYLQVRLTGDDDTMWQNLIPIADLPKGDPGPTPVISIGAVTTAPTGDPADASFTGTASEPVLNLTLPRGEGGDTGPAAWTPVIAVVADGERRVQEITDWTGGGGAKPATGFIGATGIVATAALATDIRGAGGAGSGDMLAANNLSELTDVGAARNKLDVYSKAETDTALGTKADLVGGKIPVAQIPAVAITDTFPVASQAAMLALTAERGDVAVRSDLSKSFILQAEPATTLANWKELLTPTVVVPVFATKEEVWAGNVADKIIPPKVLNDAMAPQALAIAAGVVSPDCHNGINFDIASINANITIANLANKAGKGVRSGSITGKNDATAGRTVSLGTDWKKITGSAAFPTAANAMWKLIYNIDSNGVNYNVLVLA